MLLLQFFRRDFQFFFNSDSWLRFTQSLIFFLFVNAQFLKFFCTFLNRSLCFISPLLMSLIDKLLKTSMSAYFPLCTLCLYSFDSFSAGISLFLIGRLIRDYFDMKILIAANVIKIFVSMMCSEFIVWALLRSYAFYTK